MKKHIKRILRSIFDKPLASPSEKELENVIELRKTFQGFAEYVAASDRESERSWVANMNRLRNLVLSDDPRNFLRWDVITKTMFVSDADYVQRELAYLKKHNKWSSRWQGAIQESRIGHPSPYPFYPASSGNLIHHAYHLARFEDETGKSIDSCKFVLEFGGGYGGMCRLFHNLGFCGKYIIYDLEPFTALQKFYIKNLGITVLDKDNFLTAERGVLCLSDIDDLTAILATVEPGDKSMFLATWSFSESPLSVREPITPYLKSFDYFLVAYQEQFGEVDNVSFFAEMAHSLVNIRWYSEEIAHMSGSHYLFGVPSDKQ